jgi:NADPH-dependent 7-cyano-7-deazaguanine reductase QueF-like protein
MQLFNPAVALKWEKLNLKFQTKVQIPCFGLDRIALVELGFVQPSQQPHCAWAQVYLVPVKS